MDDNKRMVKLPVFPILGQLCHVTTLTGGPFPPRPGSDYGTLTWLILQLFKPRFIAKLLAGNYQSPVRTFPYVVARDGKSRFNIKSL